MLGEVSHPGLHLRASSLIVNIKNTGRDTITEPLHASITMQAIKPERKSMPTYNHAYAVGFELSGSTDPYGEDVTAEMLREALIKRIDHLDSAGDS